MTEYKLRLLNGCEVRIEGDFTEVARSFGQVSWHIWQYNKEKKLNKRSPHDYFTEQLEKYHAEGKVWPTDGQLVFDGECLRVVYQTVQSPIPSLSAA